MKSLTKDSESVDGPSSEQKEPHQSSVDDQAANGTRHDSMPSPSSRKRSVYDTAKHQDEEPKTQEMNQNAQEKQDVSDHVHSSQSEVKDGVQQSSQVSQEADSEEAKGEEGGKWKKFQGVFESAHRTSVREMDDIISKQCKLHISAAPSYSN